MFTAPGNTRPGGREVPAFPHLVGQLLVLGVITRVEPVAPGSRFGVLLDVRARWNSKHAGERFFNPFLVCTRAFDILHNM